MNLMVDFDLIPIARICGKAEQHAKWRELRALLGRPPRPPGSVPP
jgi:hypothetical protein